MSLTHLAWAIAVWIALWGMEALGRLVMRKIRERRSRENEILAEGRRMLDGDGVDAALTRQLAELQHQIRIPDLFYFADTPAGPVLWIYHKDYARRNLEQMHVYGRC